MDTGTQREEDLFDAVRQLKDPARRQAFLDFSCSGDQTLRRRIDELLDAHDAAETFFSESSPGLDAADKPGILAGSVSELIGDSSDDPHRDEPVGTRIGRYKLVEKIGEGGCGVVYLAAQEEPVRRHVALKIIRLGMETRSVIARFEAERQALAMMDHPNIARVFDAGATDRGSPYFVMEHVRGVRITKYCDQNQLHTRERLNLFIQICHAIQHAHQKGIVHGDIKPSNIIVALHDGVPVPKVIDFGISKATEARFSENIPFSAYAQLIGTPAYMSPEQVEMGGLDVDTRSDIYSLGVLLYELLTGRTPFDHKQLMESGLEEMQKILRERKPARPSAMLAPLEHTELQKTATNHRTTTFGLLASLRGDLDWIAMKALEKDRRQRYETANGLALDVQRYLLDEPTIAHPSSWLYRWGKLFRRNRVVFVAGAAVAAALVAGTGTSTWLFLKEREARRRAVGAEQQQARLRHEAETREKITQAALLVSQANFAEADTLLRDVSLTESTMEGAAVFRSVGEWHALNGRWSQAADRFAVLLRINHLEGPDVSSLDYLERGPTLVEMEDIAGYEQFRWEVINRFAETSTPFADRIVKISLLTPANDRLLAALTASSELAAKACNEADAAGDPFLAAWQSMSLGLFEYRRGNFRVAAEWCRRCLAYPDSNAPRDATARTILAMSNHQLGRIDEARTDLRECREIVENKFGHRIDRGTPVQGFWFDWAFARILLREAEALIEGRSDSS